MDTILIVDNHSDAEITKKILAGDKRKIFICENTHDIFDRIEFFNPDLLIIKASGVDDYEICRKIKENPDTQDTVVLLLSDEKDKFMMTKAFDVGADDFLEKRFDSFALISKVKSLLRIKYLRDQLQKKYYELEQTNKILAQQLEMAQQLQHSLIPELDININGTKIFSKYLPAMYIGGDFYNVIRLSDTKVIIVLGDVSGHGISASLLTSMLINMTKNIINKRFHDPDKILYRLNHDFILAMNANDTYACVFVALINIKSKKIFYSNAGQPAPLFVSNKKIIDLDITGTPIGLMSNAEYKLKSLEYKPGDKIFFHTDGLENNFYKNDPDGFLKELKKILIGSYASTNELSNNILKKFYYGSETNEQNKKNESERNRNDIDDVSFIICEL